MTDTSPFYPSAYPPAPICLRHWAWKWQALEFTVPIGIGLGCAKAALRHPLDARGLVLFGLPFLAVSLYRAATAYLRRQTLVVNGDGITLRQGRTEQRCKWEQVTRLRRTDEATTSGGVVSRLYVERGAAAPIVLNDDWTIPHIGLLARMSEWQQSIVGTAIPVSAEGI